MASRVAWGSNNRFQLGAGFRDETERLPVGMSALAGAAIAKLIPSYYFDCCLMANQTVAGIGGNINGEIGDGTHLAKTKLTPVKGLKGVSDIAVAGAHVLSLLGDGSVRTWGGNTFGQLGTGVAGLGKEGTGSPLPVNPNIGQVAAVFAGGGNDAVVTKDGSLLMWGENTRGQIGLGENTLEVDRPMNVPGLPTAVSAVALGGMTSLGGHTLALLADGTVMSWGANAHGQLGDGTTQDSSTPHIVPSLSNVVAVAAGVSQSFALLGDGSLLGWGSNAYGELGLGSLAGTLVPMLVMGDVDEVSAGLRYTLVRSDSQALSFGWNRWAVLGDGTQSDKHVPTPITALGGEVAEVRAAEYHSTAVIGGTPPPPAVRLTAYKGALLVEWIAPPGTEHWTVKWGPILPGKRVEFGRRAEAPVGLSPGTREYTITGLTPGQAYEVVVENHTFGRRLLVGTPE